LPPHAPQLVLPQVVPVAHVAHTAPPWPHAESLVPGSQVLPEQHPVHELVSQAQAPPAQRCPGAHDPSVHAPPQPSSAPHALPEQSGVQPQTPLCPLPPHARWPLHVLPAQQGCPLPPQVPHVPVPHDWPAAQTWHKAAPCPHAESSPPG
jgi:hypothetical protein